MPIKLNGTTIFNESNFADKDLSNLSESGTQVINNMVSSAISGMTYMKNIDTNNGTAYVSSSGFDFTTPSNGWVVITNSSSNPFSLSVGEISIKMSGNSCLSMPACIGTRFKSPASSTADYQAVFYPEIS